MALTLGNDVSKWQGSINFDTLKSNAQFVIVKATEGVGFTDPTFNRNQNESRRVGLLLGYYHFARPDLGNSPEAEADFFLSTIGSLQQNELIALDYECPNQVQAHVDWCRKWLDRVLAKTGVRAFIYLNQAQTKAFNWKSVVDGNYALWIAAYTFDPEKNTFVTGAWSSAAMQQWTNNQTVPGIPNAVDGNVFFGTLTTLKKYGYQGAAPTPTPTPPATNDDALQTCLRDREKFWKERDEARAEATSLRELTDKLNQQINDRNRDISNLNAEVDALSGQLDATIQKCVSYEEIAKRVPTLEEQLAHESEFKKRFQEENDRLITANKSLLGENEKLLDNAPYALVKWVMRIVTGGGGK